MEWCGWNWACIWSNVFGTAAAAWIQAVATVAVFVWSIRTTRATFKKDQALSRRMMRHQSALQKRAAAEDKMKDFHRQHLAYSKTLAKSKVLILRLKNAAKNIVDYVEAGMHTDTQMFNSALKDCLNTARQDIDALRDVMLGDLPNPETIVLINTSVVMAEDLKSLLIHSLSGVDPAEIRLTAKRFVNNFDTLYEHVQGYHNNFANDASAIPERFTYDPA